MEMEVTTPAADVALGVGVLLVHVKLGDNTSPDVHHARLQSTSHRNLDAAVDTRASPQISRPRHEHGYPASFEVSQAQAQAQLNHGPYLAHLAPCGREGREEGAAQSTRHDLLCGDLTLRYRRRENWDLGPA